MDGGEPCLGAMGGRLGTGSPRGCAPGGQLPRQAVKDAGGAATPERGNPRPLPGHGRRGGRGFVRWGLWYWPRRGRRPSVVRVGERALGPLRGCEGLPEVGGIGIVVVGGHGGAGRPRPSPPRVPHVRCPRCPVRLGRTGVERWQQGMLPKSGHTALNSSIGWPMSLFGSEHLCCSPGLIVCGFFGGCRGVLRV